MIGHVTPFLYKQPCFECSEVFFFYLTSLPRNIVLNAKKVADKQKSKWLDPIICVGVKFVNM